MITYVTAFLASTVVHKPPESYFEWFKFILDSKVNIILFLDKIYSHKGKEWLEKYPNLTIQYITLDDTWMWNHLPDNPILPAVRNHDKDYVDFLSIQHSKFEFILKATNLTSNENFAWIDFGIAHIIRDKEAVWNKLQNMVDPPETKILTPGSWNTHCRSLVDTVCWKYLGGFFLGKRDTFEKAWERQKEIIVHLYPRITWEVNVWTLMEEYFTVYIADHNDSMIMMAGMN